MTFRAAVAVFRHRVLEVDLADGRETREPGETVGKFGLKGWTVAGSERPGEFAGLFHEPAERAVDSPVFIFWIIYPFDQGLVFAEMQNPMGRTVYPPPTPPVFDVLRNGPDGDAMELTSG